MKKLLIFIALLLISTSFTKAQKKSNDEQILIKMEREMLDAIVSGKLTSFDKYVANTATITGPSGAFMNKAESIALFKSGDLKFESSKIDNAKVRFYGNTAIVTYRTTDKGTYKGTAIDGQVRWTDTFVKTGGKWIMVATHGTPIMPQQAP